MKIHYKTKKLEKILNDDRLIKKYYTSFYNGLKNRLFELRAVSNLSLISHNPPPRKHQLSGNYKGYWSIDVSKNYRILFMTYKEWIKEEDIDEIIIMEIIDTH